MIPASNGSVLASYGDIIYVAMNYRLNVFGFFYTGDNRMANGNFFFKKKQLLTDINPNLGDPVKCTKSLKCILTNHSITALLISNFLF